MPCEGVYAGRPSTRTSSDCRHLITSTPDESNFPSRWSCRGQRASSPMIRALCASRSSDCPSSELFSPFLVMALLKLVQLNGQGADACRGVCSPRCIIRTQVAPWSSSRTPQRVQSTWAPGTWRMSWASGDCGRVWTTGLTQSRRARVFTRRSGPLGKGSVGGLTPPCPRGDGF